MTDPTKKALDAFNKVVEKCWSSINLYMSRADIPVIQAALQPHKTAPDDADLREEMCLLQESKDSLEGVLQTTKNELHKRWQRFNQLVTFIDEEIKTISYAITRGGNYDLNLAKERMTDIVNKIPHITDLPPTSSIEEGSES